MSQGCPRRAVGPIGQDDTHHDKSTGEAFQITLQTHKAYYVGVMGPFMEHMSLHKTCYGMFRGKNKNREREVVWGGASM